MVAFFIPLQLLKLKKYEKTLILALIKLLPMVLEI